ncbi:unnamed protein product [Brugia timori]|uniref:Uncharacterized protein n=1 Tax=Brugia timori TaxID=42155 RepID=A0A3P7VZS4_9BILA|nr:unnamed protein product [Brugia timori]
MTRKVTLSQIEYLVPRIAIKKSNILFLIVDGDNMALEMRLYHRSSRSVQLYSLFAHTMRQLMILLPNYNRYTSNRCQYLCHTTFIVNSSHRSTWESLLMLFSPP